MTKQLFSKEQPSQPNLNPLRVFKQDVEYVSKKHSLKKKCQLNYSMKGHSWGKIGQNRAVGLLDHPVWRLF